MQCDHDLFMSQCKSLNKSTHVIFTDVKKILEILWNTHFTHEEVGSFCTLMIHSHFFPEYTNFSCHALVTPIHFSLFHICVWWHGSLIINLSSMDILKLQVWRPCKELPPKRDHAMHPIYSDIQFFKLQIFKFLSCNLWSSSV